MTTNEPEKPLERSVKMLLDYATPRKCDDEGSMGCIRCNVIRVCNAVLTLSADCAAMREALQSARDWIFKTNHAEGCALFGLHPRACSCGKFDALKPADAALSTTAGAEYLARLERAEKELSIAQSTLRDREHQWRHAIEFETFMLTQDALPGERMMDTVKRVFAQRDAALERVKVLEAELAKKNLIDQSIKKT